MNDTDVAARLAEALAEAWSGNGRPRWTPDWKQIDFAPTAAALLPVVREIADQRAAEEAARLRKTVARVEALLVEQAPYEWNGTVHVVALRRALDGTDA